VNRLKEGLKPALTKVVEKRRRTTAFSKILDKPLDNPDEKLSGHEALAAVLSFAKKEKKQLSLGERLKLQMS
jgi:hypothetical protein